MKKSGLWPTLGLPWKSTFSGYDPIDLKGLLQRVDEALMALGPVRGNLQEATIAMMDFNEVGEFS